MYGPFEIVYGGRKYFSNIFLKEFHKFSYRGEIYLFNIDRMVVHKLTQSASAAVDKAALSTGGPFPEAMVEVLMKLALVAECDSEAVGIGVSGHSARSGAGAKRGPGVDHIALFVAQECNLRCVYCYGEGGEYSAKGMMRAETAFMAVDWLMENSRNFNKVKITFFGGEPLLNFPLIRKTVAYARLKAAERNKRVIFAINTNATLLTDEITGFIKDEELNTLISFDGPPEIQDKQRPFKDGGGSWAVVRANIQRLLAVCPHTTARATAYGDADPSRIKGGLKQAGFHSYLVMKASPVIPAAPESLETLHVKDEEISRRMIGYQDQEWDEFLRAVRSRNAEPGVTGRMLLPIILGRKLHFGCAIGKSMAAISVSGDVYPCHRFVGQVDMKMGHIADYKVTGLNDYHRNSVRALPKCSGCWARHLCGGGCFYDNKARTGDMRIPDGLFCIEKMSALQKALYVYAQLDDGDKDYVRDIYRDVVDDTLP